METLTCPFCGDSRFFLLITRETYYLTPDVDLDSKDNWGKQGIVGKTEEIAKELFCDFCQWVGDRDDYLEELAALSDTDRAINHKPITEVLKG